MAGNALRVAVVGLGTMGGGAALNLARAGHRVTGCDVREGAGAALIEAGGAFVASVAELTDDLDALVLFVVTAAQANEVLFGDGGCAGLLPKHAVVLCCVTMPPEAARAMADRLDGMGIAMLDAPVSGGAVAAKAGTMTVMASGPPAAFERAAPVLDAMARKVWRLGDAAGAGSTVKMVNQLLAGVHIATAAEAMALGIRAGADPRTLYDVICSSAGSSWMWQDRMPHVLDADPAPRSAVNIFVKDLGIVLDQARASSFPLPMAAAAHQLFLAAAAGGHGGEDDAFVIRFWEALAGIKLPEAS